MAKVVKKKETVNVGDAQTGVQNVKQSVYMTLTGQMDITKPSSGSFELYREIQEVPTVILAKKIANLPILTTNWGVRADDDVDKKVIEFINGQMEDVWYRLIRDVLLARDYGFQAFEKVWEVKSVDGVDRLVYKKLKALIPDKTELLIIRDTGDFAGIRQGKVQLPVNKSYVYTCDQEYDDYYGRSWYENIRKHAYTPWVEMMKKYRKYISKVAGVIPMIHYPPGQGKDEGGADLANWKIAKSILERLGSGNGVAIPKEMVPWADDLIRNGVDPEKLIAWQLSFLETSGDHGGSFLGGLRYYDSLMMRGMLVPERTALEGQHGTKAEAGEHGDIALAIADLTLVDIFRSINWYVVNPLLTYNYGKEMENKVWVEREGLSPGIEAFFKSIVEKVLTSPTNVDLFETWVDVDAILDQVGIPKAKEVLDVGGEDYVPRSPVPGETPEEGGEGTNTPEKEEEKKTVASRLFRAVLGRK